MKKSSHARRIKLNLAAAESFKKINELQRSLSSINEEIDRAEGAAKSEPCTCNHSLEEGSPVIIAFQQQLQALNSDLKDEDKVVPDEVCHNSKSRRCMLPSCSCRKPMPDPEVGDYAKRDDIFGQILRITEEELYPLYIRSCVTEIQGLNIDGKAATIDTLLEDAPDGLVSELGFEIQKLIRVSAEEALGFKSPTTSDGQVDGPKIDTESMAPSTAPSASESSPTLTECAAAPI